MITYRTFKKWSVLGLGAFIGFISYWCASQVGPAPDGSFVEAWLGFCAVACTFGAIACVIIGLTQIYEN